MLASSVVDRGFIGDVIFSVLDPSVVDRGIIGDVKVSVGVDGTYILNIII